jgi:hypothetical protein
MTLHIQTVTFSNRPHLHVYLRQLHLALPPRCSMHVADSECVKNFSRETSTKKQLTIHVHAWNDNIKMDLTKIRCGDVEVLVNTAKSLQVPRETGYFLSISMTMTLWRTFVYGDFIYVGGTDCRLLQYNIMTFCWRETKKTLSRCTWVYTEHERVRPSAHVATQKKLTGRANYQPVTSELLPL